MSVLVCMFMHLCTCQCRESVRASVCALSCFFVHARIEFLCVHARMCVCLRACAGRVCDLGFVGALVPDSATAVGACEG